MENELKPSIKDNTEHVIKTIVFGAIEMVLIGNNM